MKKKNIPYIFREPYVAPEEFDGAPPEYSLSVENGMIIERDVAVPMRDGVTIYINVFRPENEQPAAPIIGWGPYGKHGHTKYETIFPNWGGDPDHYSDYCAFEAADPLYWVPRGYAIIDPDPRGTWYSEGKATYLSPEEADDFHDLIEWAGTQSWSNGKVGLTGVSYLACAQWRVAGTNPPHLAAINPWEGWSDTYREVVRHGGIPETYFWPYVCGRWGASTTEIEDLITEHAEHPFFDELWASKAADEDFPKTTVPAYVVASWTDHGMHTRGTIEGFMKIASEHKWLEIHGRKKWAYYYEPECVARLQEFFDHFLLGRETGVMSWPRVRLEVRERFYQGPMRGENEWPLARTSYEKLYLDANNNSLDSKPPAAQSEWRYHAPGENINDRAQFDMKFDAATELIGYMKLRLWVGAEGSDDMDLFVAVQKLDGAGEVVPFAFWAHFDDGPVALGWLRVSHRELDEKRSTEHQPVLKHARELKLKEGEIVPVDIEIWPSGTRFEAGEGLRLVVQGWNIYDYEKPVMCDRYEDLVNKGTHVIYTGGQYDSHLLVPFIPEK